MGGGGVKARAANPRGYPDFTLPVSIIAQLVEKLKVDIIAQTLAQVDVNIAAQAVTLSVSVVGTANIYIEDAVIYASLTVAMEKGTIVRCYGLISNGDSLLYSVPAGKKAILVCAQANMLHYAAGDHECCMYLYWNATGTRIITLAGPDAVDQANDSISAGAAKLPEGAQLRIWANAYTSIFGQAVVIEYG